MTKGSHQASPTYGNTMCLTKREYFAALAMQGELAQDNSYSRSDACLLLGISEPEFRWEVHYPIFLAKRSVQYADALIDALNQTP